MAYLRSKHPWNPGYALPGSVKLEPAGRGTLVTKGLPRGSSDGPWAFRSKSPLTPHGTVSTLVPDELAPLLTKEGVPLQGLGSLGGSSLGDTRPFGAAPGGNPFAAFGQGAAKLVVDRLALTEPSKRNEVAERILHKLDPSLPGKVKAQVAKNRAAGMAPDTALEAALAQGFTQGIQKEVVEIGKKGRMPMGLGIVRVTAVNLAPHVTSSTVTGVSTGREPSIKKYLSIGGPTIPVVFKSKSSSAMRGQAGYRGRNWAEVRSKLPKAIAKKIEDIVARPGTMGVGKVPATAALGYGKIPILKIMGGNGIFVTLKGPFEAKDVLSNLSKVSEVVVDVKPYEGGNFVTRAASDAINAVTDVFVGAAKFIIKIVDKVAEVVEDVVDTIGDLACSVAGHPASTIAASAGAASQGAPPESGAAGVAIVNQACGRGTTAPPMVVEQGGSIWPWLALGGGALLVVWGLKK